MWCFVFEIHDDGDDDVSGVARYLDSRGFLDVWDRLEEDDDRLGKI